MTAGEVVVVGAGGHAKVCIELLRAGGADVVFCVGTEGSEPNCLGVPVLIGDHQLAELRSRGLRQAFVAIGSNRGRAALGELVRSTGFELVNALSPAAVISPTAVVGSGVAIMAGAVVNAAANIGDLAIVNTGATIDHDCFIGPASHIAPGSSLAGNVTIGAGVFLGVGTCVIPERTIGDHTQVGAGGVVVHDLPSGVLALGVPARIVDRS